MLFKEKMPKYITDNIEISSDEENSDKENSDEENYSKDQMSSKKEQS